MLKKFVVFKIEMPINLLHSINNDSLFEILKFLDFKELISLKLVSKGFKMKCSNPFLYETLDFSTIPKNFTNGEIEEILKNFPQTKTLIIDKRSRIKSFLKISELCPLIETLSILNCSNIKDLGEFKNLKLLKCHEEFHKTLYEPLIEKNSSLKIELFEPQEYIYIKTLNGQQWPLFLSLQNSVYDLKVEIGFNLGIPEDQIRLVYYGKKLEDSRILSDYNCQYKGTFHCILRLRGAGEHLTDKDEFDQLYNMIDFDGVRNKKQVMENVFTFQLFTKEFCQKIKDNKFKIAKNTQNKIILLIQSLLFPGEYFRFVDTFMNHYNFETETELILHIDQSQYTLNICLDIHELKGTDLIFYTSNSYIVEELPFIEDVKEFEKFSFSQTGEAILHFGSLPHKVSKLQNGSRDNLIFLFHK